jgi:hypothetical protein
MLQARRDVSTKPRVAIARTPLSHAFEDFYRALPVDGGRIPDRGAFRPERAGKFLKHLVLCEAVSGLRMRLVGGAVQDRSQRNLKGENYLDYLLPEFRAAAMFVIRELVGRPCGLWQVQPMLSEHGAVQSTELTGCFRWDRAPTACRCCWC